VLTLPVNAGRFASGFESPFLTHLFTWVPLKVTHVTFTQQMSNRDSALYLCLNSIHYEYFIPKIALALKLL